MSIVTVVVLAGIGCYIAHQNSPAAQEERRLRIQERMNKIMEPIRKKKDKIKFITKFIDEIPELSYYEAAQLKNKLGDIYLEWNDE
jgi:hypothetical protein